MFHQELERKLPINLRKQRWSSRLSFSWQEGQPLPKHPSETPRQLNSGAVINRKKETDEGRQKECKGENWH